MKTFLKVLLMSGMTIMSYNSKTQAQSISDGNAIPPSPTAASLGEYADVPVGTYTGTPSINIPIYEATSGVLTAPIILSYHGGGIKVAQEASWVGLGWSLQAGGVISRTIRGGDDLNPNANNDGINPLGYVYAPDLPPHNPDNSPYITAAQIPYYREMADGYYDLEPDIFYYNFGTLSGKFILEKCDCSWTNNPEFVGIPLEQNGVEIRYSTADQQWVITDGDGNKYYFSTQEITKTYSKSESSDNDFVTKQNTISNPDFVPPAWVTSWYLDKITSPVSTDEILFEYEALSHETTGQLRKSQKSLKLLDLSHSCSSSCASISPQSNGRYNIYSGSVDLVQDVYLKKINFENGYVSFVTGDRLDMDSESNTYNPQRLESIEVYRNGDVNPILTGAFTYDYFQKQGQEDNSLYSRLRLDGFQLIGSQNVSHPPYEFQYIDPGFNIPAKDSYAVDHWGYFNGTSNNTIQNWDKQPGSGTLLPGLSFLYVNSGNPVATYIHGANREPHETSAKIFSLNQIKYPTGGTHTFEWELNDYYGERKPDPEINVDLPALCDFDINGVRLYGEETFTLDQSTKITIDVKSYTHHAVWVNGNLVPADYEKPVGKTYAGIRKWDEMDQKWINHKLFKYTDDDPTALILTYKENFPAYLLEAGHYKIFIEPAEDLCAEAYISYPNIDPVPIFENVKAAGLRVSKVSISEGSNTIVKKYDYSKNGSSTGTLMSPITYYHGSAVDIITAVGVNSCVSQCISQSLYITGSSTSVIPLAASAQGNFVGYNEVTELWGELGDGGKTIYYYSNDPDELPQTEFPHLPGVPNPKNGKLIKVEHYDNANPPNLLQEQNYHYELKTSARKNVKGIIKYTFPAADNSSYQFYFYDNHSDWCYLNYETTTIYEPGDINKSMATTKRYAYDDLINKLPTKITYHNGTPSNQFGDIIETKYYYPNYFTYNSNPSDDSELGSNLLRDAHKINQILKTEEYVEGLLVSKSEIEYGENGKLIPISNRTFANGTNASKVELFHEYDLDGNLLEISRMHDIHVSYIWGYNNTLPIVKADGVDYTTLKTAFDAVNGDLEALRDHTSLTEAQITTYTYDPLIGMTSQTDPNGLTTFYEYDDLNRLKLIKDHEGNILQHYEYHYHSDS
ncbi:hypothetical protein QQ020_14845 [Fulvivirgaceae bacterium BMA12]|uniref:Uncharacterized protein n=1 Tax=Agaribacillus aureus TaxID=3051825 RepID=A0ABT8L6G7_9BACT|nr:hypothetical protein [Fulvivirgaceae bacterium BMA12]